jgi:hypothetical protein
VSIENHQGLKRGITKLKMPRYYDEAANLFKAFEPNGFKGDRYVQLTIWDESELDTPATENEIKAAKHILFCKLLIPFHAQHQTAILESDMRCQSLDLDLLDCQ